jgi:16S rRNA (cytosine967-C5)-methyltransferase
MTPGARVAAAIEVLGTVEAQRRPAPDALKDWGLAHRFAGSKDRAAIASLVYDGLRRRASAGHLMGNATPRAILLGALRLMRGLSLDEVRALFSGAGHSPPPLDEDEAEHYATGDLTGASPNIAGDFPEWLEPSLVALFGPRAVEEGQGLALRAPLDLRVNLLKATREQALARLSHLGAQPTPLSPLGLRLPLAPDGRGPSMAAEPAFVKGLVEVQDEGSQLASLLSLARPGEQVLDLCAGAGGKTLALAALMENKGQIYAHDEDGRRLMQILSRIERAGVRNVQVRPPRRESNVLADLDRRCDLVLIDAPCTGTGTWRRNPDAKWRVRPGALEQRILEQDQVLLDAVRFVKPGGRILYVTCSLLREENEDRIAQFLLGHPEFEPMSAAEMVERVGLPELEKFASGVGPGLRLSPATTGTDGFYIAMVRRVRSTHEDGSSMAN